MRFLLDENIPPSLVILLTYLNILEKHLSTFAENLLEGALVVIDEEKIRVRMLPIRR